MPYWTNDDGLNLRFGVDRATPAKMGRVSTAGDEQELVVSIDYSDVGSTDAVVGTHPLAGLPDSASIVSATLHVTEAFTSGGSATLDIGLFNDDGDGTYSTNDDNGIDAAIACDFQQIKLNAVVLRNHNHDEILDLVNFCIDRSITIGIWHQSRQQGRKTLLVFAEHETLRYQRRGI